MKLCAHRGTHAFTVRARGIRGFISMLAVGGVVGSVERGAGCRRRVAGDPPLATSSNVQLVAHIPGSAAGMNFKDHYAYVSGWGGITVLDIAKADSPQLVGALPLPHFENEDVDLCGNTLIVVNDREARGPRLGHVRRQHREPDRPDRRARSCRSA